MISEAGRPTCAAAFVDPPPKDFPASGPPHLCLLASLADGEHVGDDLDFAWQLRDMLRAAFPSCRIAFLPAGDDTAAYHLPVQFSADPDVQTVARADVSLGAPPRKVVVAPGVISVTASILRPGMGIEACTPAESAAAVAQMRKEGRGSGGPLSAVVFMAMALREVFTAEAPEN
jgi:hypothetical protein